MLNSGFGPLQFFGRYMSLAIFNISSSGHATVVIRNLSCKQREGRTANFTCNTRLNFYMYSLTISIVFERKVLKVYQGYLLAWLDADV